MYFECLNQNLQVAFAVTEDIQSGNLSVKLSATKYPICYSKVICLSTKNQFVGTESYSYKLSSESVSKVT